jgi:imidazolonepropionase-like amidohydrolase
VQTIALPSLRGRILASALLLSSLTACATAPGPDLAPQDRPAPFPTTYAPLPATPVLITGATVLTGTGARLDGAEVLLADGLIAGVGHDLAAPENASVLDARGRWVTPGLIDVHSHLGVYPSPSHEANQDGNEMTDPNTAEVWAEHSVWPQDPQLTLALAGGVTTLQILPGSANLFGGRGVTLKNVPARTVQAMKFPGAPHSLKMACGENPKSVYGKEKDQAPASRMANVAGYRAAWIKAAEYIRKRDAYDKKIAAGEEAEVPERDLELDTLAGVLRGEILVHNHCYRAEEMAVMIDVAKEFGYRIAAFHHAVEAYKVADLLAREGVCAAMWPEWWGFKHEAFDMVEENVALVDRAGACAIVHSDSAVTGQHLNQEAAKIMAAANRSGFGIDRAHAVRWITLNAASALGVAERTGSLEPGKMADVVVWDGDPFSVYTKAEKVFIDGALLYDAHDRSRQPVTDFDLGILDARGERP